MPQLSVQPPEVGALVDEWDGPGFRVQLHTDGLMFVMHTPEQIPHLYLNAGRTIETLQERRPELQVWYAALICEGLPEMTITPSMIRAGVPDEVKAGAVAIVAASELGAVLASWLRGVIRGDLRVQGFDEREAAGRWLAEVQPTDRRGQA